MHWYHLALWGLTGGFMIEGMEYVRIIRANKGQLPAEFRTGWSILSLILRIGIGSGLTVILGMSNESLSTPASAAAIGIAAPAILEKLGKNVPQLP